MNHILSVAGLIAVLLLPVIAQAAEGAAPPVGPKRLALAQALMDAGDERAHQVQTMVPMESMLVNIITTDLAVTDSATTPKVTTIVHDTMSAANEKVFKAQAEAYAANFSDQELSDILAFMNSPAGRAEKANLPLLHTALTAALSPPFGTSTAQGIGDAGDAEQVFEQASPAKRQLILRILKAQDFEARTRKGFERLSLGIPNGLLMQQEAEYVRVVVAVDRRFYVDHFSDAELAASAGYLESEAGQALQNRLPLVRRAVAPVLLEQWAIAIASLSDTVCGKVICTPQQRAAVADFTDVMAKQLSAKAQLPG